MNKKIASIALAISLLTPNIMPLDQQSEKANEHQQKEERNIGKRVKASIPPHIKKYLPANNTHNFAIAGAALDGIVLVVAHLMGMKKDLCKIFVGIPFALIAGGYAIDVTTNSPSSIYEVVQKRIADEHFSRVCNVTFEFIKKHPNGTSPDYWATVHSEVQSFVNDFCYKTDFPASNHTQNASYHIQKELFHFLHDVVAAYLMQLESFLGALRNVINRSTSDWRNEDYQIEYYESIRDRFLLRDELLSKQLLSLAQYLENCEQSDTENK